MTEPTLPGVPVDIPLPPDTCLAFGYGGDARYVAFCWWQGADTVAFDDGQCTATGNGWGFQCFRRHRAVAPLLRDFQFGSSETEAQHALLVDTVKNRAIVASVSDAADFVAAQHPEPTQEQIAELARQIEAMEPGWREERVDQAEVMRRMQEQRAILARFMDWLNQCPTPQQGEGRG